ncbi:ribosome biogenesis GTP-binding protein [Candidatus Phytoplasma luffae]|uniref:Ribosome-binding ATPase YchF n=1 Tax=Loofah witches'-broom phytoplasma TaxID=35773 RepID=A0A975FJA7_LOWBP|nr:redox-regulated ATPase YchF [Candidatus Phytoplasma luffae]QTX02891.1 ribosome biogenesis GTP-binding protein [Candidatus Phytoplasma luffae]QTX03010.1 ribosome biogenesis GTP-binding protein [Candidatus Phytoplasma luffae]
MKLGIIGLPNVGKSTLFNTITNMNVLEANYPFATIQPNVGIVSVTDDRLNFLAHSFKSQKVIQTQIQFVDIAGLVKNASKGEGLGNKFLGHIKDVDAVCHVVKCFEDPNIIHVYDKIDPVEESNIIEIELILSDLEQIEKRLLKLNKTKKTKEECYLDEIKLLNKLKNHLEKEMMNISEIDLNEKELKIIKSLNLLSLKPMIYIGNFKENDLNDLQNNLFFKKMSKYSEEKKRKFIPVCVLLEKEISTLDIEEQKSFLQNLNLKKSALEEIIQNSYKLLGLQTYFTSGPTETRAWSFIKGMTASECAGLIHSDFQKGFIKAEIYNYEDLKNFPNFSKIKENGKLRLEGRNYLVQDGDIIHFYFNVSKQQNKN